MPEQSGLLNRSFELGTNDPKNRVVKVTLRARVFPLPAFVSRLVSPAIERGDKIGAFTVWPTAHAVVTLQHGEELTLSFRIKRDLFDSGISGAPAATSDLVRIGSRGEIGTGLWVDVTLGPFDKPGRHSASVKIPVSGGNVTELAISVGFTVLEDSVIVTPRSLDLGEISMSELREGVERAARIGIRKQAAAVGLKSVSSTSPFLKLETQTIVDGANYVIRVTLSGGANLSPGSFNGQLVIETDDKDQPRIEVPVKVKITQ
jgi:hypothetical protein